MPSYVPITDEMCLVHQEVKSKVTTVEKREPVNHIWIYDRSGSMYYTLSGLCEQLMILSKKLPKGDTLSLGWFSGEGDFNFIIKGFKISDEADYDTLERAIRKNSSVRNTTCFSEILHNSSTVIEDLSIMSDTFSLHFFTDGYPVVRNYRREIESIFEAINKIKGKIHSAMFIGYGYYYNKELMAQMAEKLGALLIHSTMVNEYSDSITRLVKLSEIQEPKQEVESLVENPLAVFTVSDQGVMLYGLDDDGKLYISPQKGRGTSVFYVSNEKPNKKSWKRVNIDDIDFADTGNKYGKGLYAAALVLTQQAKTDLALEFIGKVGDKKVVDSLTNAFTIEEYGQAEDVINKGLQDISERFIEGRDANYLPPDDAFCAFDLLGILVNDDEASFYPYHENFHYEKIGVPTKTKGDYPKFMADKDIQCPFNQLVWHSSRLNLNVQTRIKGVVHLKEVEGKTGSDLELPEYFNTFVFRNYTFIKDGRVHIKKFYVKTSEKTYLELKNKGIVTDDDFKNSGVYAIDVSGLPAINRKIATGRTSATDLCKLSMEEQKLKGQIKALKWLKNEEIGEQKVETTEYNDDQIAFLEANGINLKKGGLYQPPMETAEASDQYIAKAFKIKIAKMSSLPTVKKVMDKIAVGKSRTPVEYLVEEGINLYDASKSKLSSTETKTKWFDETIKGLQKTMLGIRSQIQETKFAVILGKKWFDEFESRDETTLEVDGISFTFDLGEETVNL